MYAIRLHETGPAENLRYETVADPRPATGQARIAVSAAGVHLLDTALRRGDSPYTTVQLPTIPGREVAGTVISVGDEVSPDWIGVPVVTHLSMNPGGYAELAIQDVERLHVLPPTVPFDKAVAMIDTGRTAMSILELARLIADDIVLITGAAGGIGDLTVQYAARLGATTVASASGAGKVQHARRRGADITVDHRLPHWPQRVRDELGHRRVNVILHGGGEETAPQAYELLEDGGRMVLYGSEFAARPSQSELDAKNITFTSPAVPQTHDRHRGIGSLESRALGALTRGELDPQTTTFPLWEAAAAHTALEEHHTTGKVVLTRANNAP